MAPRRILMQSKIGSILDCKHSLLEHGIRGSRMVKNTDHSPAHSLVAVKTTERSFCFKVSLTINVFFCRQGFRVHI